MKIAIVDDEEKWRNLASDVVKSYTDESDKIEVFSSGVEFLKRNVEYNIVLMDIDMPQMDGFETIINYKERYSESIIIILTTHLRKKRISGGCIPVCGQNKNERGTKRGL